MVLEVAALSAVARILPGGAAAAAFVLGWVLQFVGHRVFEGRSPAFLSNLIHILVGPAWLLRKYVGGRLP